MNKIIEFWNQNASLITNFLTISLGAFLTFLVNRFLKGAIDKVLNYSTQIVSKMFGGDVSLNDVNEHIKKLPFVDDFNSFVKDLNVRDELKLIDLKRKMNSPNLSEVEKLVFENEYKVLIELIGKTLTKETSEILDKIDNLSE